MEEQTLVEGEINLPLLATIFNKLELGGRLWSQQFTKVFLIVGYLAETRAYVAATREGPGLILG